MPPCECRCDKGWLTAATQDLSDYKYCGVSSAATPAPTPAASPSTFRLELSRRASFLTREREEREREKKKTGVARFFRNPKKNASSFLCDSPRGPLDQLRQQAPSDLQAVQVAEVSKERGLSEVSVQWRKKQQLVLFKKIETAQTALQHKPNLFPNPSLFF